tara:strand:+ start:773 stop:1444 length:672 start_codon:yes stop_codon:yes gene_type:complete
MVYLIQNESRTHYKIGKSKNIEQRLSGLGTGNHETLYVISALDGGYKLETVLRRYFDEFRTKKEWFLVNGKILRFFESNEKLSESETLALPELADFILPPKKGFPYKGSPYSGGKYNFHQVGLLSKRGFVIRDIISFYVKENNDGTINLPAQAIYNVAINNGHLLTQKDAYMGIENLCKANLIAKKEGSKSVFWYSQSLFAFRNKARRISKTLTHELDSNKNL